MIRVTINACKDLLRSLLRRRTVSLDEVLEQPAPIAEDHREVLETVLSLPVKYKDVVYLHYYEGYTASQIGEILGKKPIQCILFSPAPGRCSRKNWGRVYDGQ